MEKIQVTLQKTVTVTYEVADRETDFELEKAVEQAELADVDWEVGTITFA